MRRAAWVIGAVLAPVVGGCGSSHTLPPAPEPAESPPLAGPPAGRVVRIGNGPEGLAFDSRTGLLAVGLRRPAAVALVHGRSGRVARRVRMPAAPRHLQLAKPGGPVLVPAEGADALVELSLPGGGTSTTRVGDFPHDATAARGRVFAGNEFGDSVSALRRGRRAVEVPAPAQPGGVAAVGGRIAVVAVRARVLRLYDASSLRALATIHAGVGPTHLVAGRRARLYVVDTQGDALLEFATRPSLRLIGRVHLAGFPYGIAIDPKRGRLWVTLTERNELVRLRIRPAGPPALIDRYRTVRQPNTVAVDRRSGRVFVAGRAAGALQIIDPGLAARADLRRSG